MTEHRIPLIVTLCDIAGEEHEVEIVFPCQYDSGHVLAISAKEIVAQATAVLCEGDEDLKALAEADSLSPVQFRKAGETSRYVVNGAYDGDGGPFGSEYQAVDGECATLQALWEMACNHYDGHEDVDLDELVHYMGNCSVFDAEPEPVPAHEQKQLLVDLVTALRDGGDVEGALAKAESALVTMGDIEPRLSGPSI